MLIAVDTSIMIRLAMRDDEAHYQKALALLTGHQFFISRTVQLEMEWVLRSRYKQSVEEIANFFSLLLQKTKILCENEEELINAICWYRLGADFADAIHLAHTKSLPFYTFDERFCKKAIQQGIAPRVNFL
ncbi:MAG: type II toxin-antitoxin system VapC family toxin [Methylovulum sp.]|uniref:type II toxin-antitoxin system VapC family toxin n=1 Tax=Methylovulum sp. TaxID=1916980 RepID=UPI002615B2B4|nr:type II toxin-antitoxin system VapC family toxin [Methylovulum sp.]MDD2724843.1 type II toxin-antitoxin system VapC family toxin [Methylovulum sp.]MDD5124945.1 type II toxin-antitoxin system VapC family toxin [Methylovulum sp.]